MPKKSTGLPDAYPKRNERWLHINTGQTARVMSEAPIEGYVVARYKGGGPWLLHVNEWHKNYRPAK